jgi:archaemetzincin
MDCGRPTSTVRAHELDAFPAPLVLPGDDIEGDPNYPPQSFREWLNTDERNHVTPSRKVLYVAAPPAIDSSVAHMRDWQRVGWGRQKITVR